MLDLTALRRAIEALERALNVSHNAGKSLGADIELVLRAGVIQGFEVAYEQCWKFIQRWIRENRTREEGDFPRSRRDLFRQAARYRLIEDPTPWFSYGDARNLTSHAYNEEKAQQVALLAKSFLVDAKELLTRLEQARD